MTHGPHSNALSHSKLLNIIVNDRLLDLSDFIEICTRARRLAPHIHIFLGNPGSRAEQVSPQLWSCPTVTLGIGSGLGDFIPRRGDILNNKPVSKLDQFAVLGSKGVPTPRTGKFDFRHKYDPEVWGGFVLLKPAPLSLSSKGRHIKIVRTARLNDFTREQFVEFIGTSAPVLIQSFIDTGSRPNCWRVLTLFGEPLYSTLTTAPVERPPLSAPDADLDNAYVVSKHVDWKSGYDTSQMLSLASEPDVIDLAKQTAACFPRIPLLGIDILRDHVSGKLYALEINAGGNVWHFSSTGNRMGQEAISKEDRINQFGAWDVAARALIEATNRLAR